MTHNIHNIDSASALFNGKTYLLTVCLDSWQPEISSNLTSYEFKITNDPTFIASTLTIVDTRINGWLTKCTTKTESCNIDNEIVDISDLRRSIKILQFQFNLPPSIR